MKNYYKILEISRDATDDEIKRAYHKLAKKYHPDANKSTNTIEIFLAINEAYEILSDKEKRKQYDLDYEESTNHIEKTSENLDEKFKANAEKKARRQALSDIFDEQELQLNKLMTEKHNFLTKAIMGKYSHKEYYEKVKKIVIDLEKSKKNLIEFKKLLEQEFYFSLIEKVEGALYYIKEAIKELDMDLENLKINKDGIVLENIFSSLIKQKLEDLTSSIVEFYDFIEEIYLLEVSKTNYQSIYTTLSLALEDQIAEIEQLSNICDEYNLRNQKKFIIGIIDDLNISNNQHFNLTYEELISLGERIHMVKDMMNNFDEWVNIKHVKIDKVRNIMNTYPKNKKCKTLYDYAMGMYNEQLTYYNSKIWKKAYWERSICISKQKYFLAIDMERIVEKESFEFFTDYASINSLKALKFPKKMEYFSIDYGGKQFFFFKGMKTYGDFIKRYKMTKKFAVLSQVVALTGFLELIRELIFVLIKTDSNAQYLGIKFFTLGPLAAITHLIGLTVKNYISDMKDEIDCDKVAQKIFLKGK